MVDQAEEALTPVESAYQEAVQLLSDCQEALDLTKAQVEEQTTIVQSEQEKVIDAQSTLSHEQALLESLQELTATLKNKEHALQAATDTLEEAQTALSEIQSKFDEAKTVANDLQTKVEEAQKRLEDVNHGQDVWTAVKGGTNDVYTPVYTDYQPLADAIETYKVLRSQLEELDSEIVTLQAQRNEAEAAYTEALTQVEKATQDVQKAQDALDAYFASLEAQEGETIVVETPTTEDSTSEGVDTATKTQMSVFVGGMVLSGALAALYLKHRKETE